MTQEETLAAIKEVLEAFRELEEQLTSLFETLEEND
jgi:hypothetical protein